MSELDDKRLPRAKCPWCDASGILPMGLLCPHCEPDVNPDAEKLAAAKAKAVATADKIEAMTKPPASEQRMCATCGDLLVLAPVGDAWICRQRHSWPAPPEQPARGDGVRRSWEGIAADTFLRVNDRAMDDVFIGRICNGFEGKRVRIDVTVLDDAPGKDGAK